MNGLYIRRLDPFCVAEGDPQARFFLALDEYGGRGKLLTQVSRDMYGDEEPPPALIEPPFHLESHRYETV